MKIKAQVALVLSIVLIFASVFSAEARPNPTVTVGQWEFTPNGDGTFTLTASNISVTGLSRYYLRLDVQGARGNTASVTNPVVATSLVRKAPASMVWSGNVADIQSTCMDPTTECWLARVYADDANWGNRAVSTGFFFSETVHSAMPPLP